MPYPTLPLSPVPPWEHDYDHDQECPLFERALPEYQCNCIRCIECDEPRRGDARVEAGMKCGDCAYSE